MAKYNKTAKSVPAARVEPALAVLVTSDFEGFEVGDLLSKESDIAEYFRSEMQEREGDWHADDDAIIAIVRKVPQPDVNVAQPADFDPEQAGWEWSDMKERATYFAREWEESVLETLATSNSVQGTEDDRARANAVLPDTRNKRDIDLAPGRFGVEIDNSAEMQAALHAAAMAPIDNMKAPAKVLLASLTFAGITIGNDGMPSAWQSTFDGRPVPGSKPSEAYLKATGNKVLSKDTYKFAEYNVKPRGSSSIIKYDYWKSVVDQTAEAKRFGKVIDEVKLAMPSIKSKEAPKGDYKNNRTSTNQGTKRENEAGLNGMYRGMKNAVSAWFVMRDIATHPVFSKNIGVSFVTVKPGRDNTVDSVMPIRIWDKNVQNGPDKAYTVSNFANLDLDRALNDKKLTDAEGVGTFSAVVNSTKTGEQEGDIEGAKPLTAETVKTALTDLAAYITVRANAVDIVSAGNSKPGKNEEDELGFTPEANDIVLNVVNIVRSLVKASNDWERSGRFDKITELRDQQHAEANAEAMQSYGT